MKKLKLARWVLFGIWATCGSAYADFNDFNALTRLSTNSYELNQAVQNSSLRYEVKTAVYDFSVQVQGLMNCRPDCQDQVRSLVDAWNPVDQYLQYAEYEHPQVFQEYIETRDSLAVVLEEFGGGIPDDPAGIWFTVNGMINNQSFNFSGSNRNEIYHRCLNFGRSSRITFVNRLIIRNQVIRRHSNRIEGVCRTVSEHARVR
jgi:hypothetical protein